jgi:hypothetical protein
MGTRQRFGKDFKLEAVRLLELGHKPAAQLALELGRPLPVAAQDRERVAHRRHDAGGLLGLHRAEPEHNIGGSRVVDRHGRDVVAPAGRIRLERFST